MKKLTLILAVVLIQFDIAHGQSKIQELGLAYSGNNYFGVRYQLGTEKFLVRLTALNIGGTSLRFKDDNTVHKYIDQGIGLNLGIIKQTSIFDDVNFYYGVDFLSSFSNYINSYSNGIFTKSENKTTTAGLGCVLGFAYHFSKHVSLSAEILPAIWYSLEKDSNTNGTTVSTHSSHSTGYGFNRYSNSYANLTLSFRIRPKEEK